MVLEQRLKKIFLLLQAIDTFQLFLLYDPSISTLYLTCQDHPHASFSVHSEAMLTLRMISTTTSRKERCKEPKLETSVSR